MNVIILIWLIGLVFFIKILLIVTMNLFHLLGYHVNVLGIRCGSLVALKKY